MHSYSEMTIDLPMMERQLRDTLAKWVIWTADDDNLESISTGYAGDESQLDPRCVIETRRAIVGWMIALNLAAIAIGIVLVTVGGVK